MFNDAFRTFGNIYDGVRQGAKTIFEPVKNIVNAASRGVHAFDNLIRRNDLPFLQGVANIIKEDPIYNEIIHGVDTAGGIITSVERYGKELDAIIQRGLLGREQIVDRPPLFDTSLGGLGMVPPQFSTMPLDPIIQTMGA